MIKLIAMDMDGTLLNPQQQISEGNIRALKTAKANGIHLCLCSGRMPDNLSRFALQAGIDDAHILALNGGRCLEKPLGNVLKDHFLPHKTALACMEILDSQCMEYCVFHGDFIVQNHVFQSQEDFNSWIGRGKWADQTRYGAGPDDVAEALRSGVHKLVCIDKRNPGRLQSLCRELEEKVSGIEITSSWHDNIEVMPTGINKGSALLELAQRLGLQCEEIMAIGDNGNDQSMIEVAGCGVCMGNGVESLKAIADYVTGSNAEDGVAQAIYRFALNK